MRIESLQLRFEIDRSITWLENIAHAFTGLGSATYPLRYSIAGIDGDTATLETSVVVGPAPEFSSALQDNLSVINQKSHQAASFGIVQIIPAGIRCEFGGYAGDATPVTNLLSSAADFVITHPNAVNASDINEMASNVLYVEGKSLDEFMLGRVALRRTTANSIGTLIDPTGIAYRDSVIHTLNAGRAVAGFNCGRYTILKEDLGVEVTWNESGSASGTVANPGAILKGVELMIGDGATAIGGVSVIHGVTREMSEAHMQGKIPNPSGAVEAIITHLISKIFKIPTAHAPLPYYQDVKHPTIENPRASAEFISMPHYFSVLKGLHTSPQILTMDSLDEVPPDAICINNVGAVVMPASALGGIPALAAEFSSIPIIAVKENGTILKINNATMGMDNVIEVETYTEAAGIVLALKNGIFIDSLKRPVLSQDEIGQ